ncbi:MAG: hypothetical protein LAQ30_08375 [Acidobacteriia bacterium]|nr:hypothetical protein [Terriglobia bacterium]
MKKRIGRAALMLVSAGALAMPALARDRDDSRYDNSYRYNNYSHSVPYQGNAQSYGYSYGNSYQDGYRAARNDHRRAEHQRHERREHERDSRYNWR